MTSVVLLGASSMLGREIARQLLSTGVEVIRAGRQLDCDIFVDLGSHKMPTYQRAYRADVLIHCASAFGDTPDCIQRNLCVNIGGCIHCLEIARVSEIKKLVYAGSILSCPGVDSHTMSPYGFSKAEAERILAWGITQSGGQFCSLRFPQLWDTEGDCSRHQPWFGRIVAYASRGLILRMPVSNGPRNFMHVSDAAQLLIRAAGGDLKGIHPVRHPVDVDLADLAKAAYNVFDQGGCVTIDRAKEPFRKIMFPNEAGVFALLGYRPQISPEQGLRLIRAAGTAHRFGPLDVE